jgi:hypothetical protein
MGRVSLLWSAKLQVNPLQVGVKPTTGPGLGLLGVPPPQKLRPSTSPA